jgi:hypothetical protein
VNSLSAGQARQPVDVVETVVEVDGVVVEEDDGGVDELVVVEGGTDVVAESVVGVCRFWPVDVEVVVEVVVDVVVALPVSAVAQPEGGVETPS